MTTAGAPAGLVPIHVGHPAPAAEAAPTGDRAGGAGSRWMRGQRSRRSPFVDPGIEWQRHGFEPRWVGMETSDCAAALEPNIFRTGGESELERFMSGAAGRGETALIVATIGDAGDDPPARPSPRPTPPSACLHSRARSTAAAFRRAHARRRRAG